MMSKFFVIESFELHDGQLENWKILSKEIDIYMAKVEGFISRNSGIDENNKIYCLVKWQSKSYQEEAIKRLELRDDYNEIMAHFNNIANMQTNKRQEIEIF
jgi:hypothetical protein